MTKLRPFVNTFLKEGSKLFEMYIYTMGKRSYALEMAKLLDHKDIHFHSRVIAKEDCTQRHQKGLDVVLGKESAILILDDTESILKTVRTEVLKGCKVIFDSVPKDEHLRLWKMA
ncbi:RNA polymerase II C-terminal domain phosphatase-like 4 [Forsythia ovata]|uniref:protein-serine/threonine phosphatase n=1 Tax=Forsythia ovata TaxID=205694 RepID=A0ABD1VII1_9LAMI